MKNMIKVFVMVFVAVGFLFYCKFLPQDNETRQSSRVDEQPLCKYQRIDTVEAHKNMKSKYPENCRDSKIN